MPLQIIVENLENVEPALQSFYVEKDGAFHLDVDLETFFETRVTGLKSALQKERDTNGLLKKHIGMKPEELHAALTNVTSDRVNTLVKQYEEKHAVEIAALQNENKIIRDHEHSVIRNAVLSEGLRQARATADGMKLIPELLSNRFRVDAHEGKRTIVILNESGDPMSVKNSDGSERAGTFGDLLSETIARFPGQFLGTGAGGGGTPPKGGGGSGASKTISSSEFGSLGAREKAAKMAEGFKIV
jgi:hypothetical protein